MNNILRSRRPVLSAALRPRRSGTTRAGRVLVVVGAVSLAAGLAVAPSMAAGESTTAVLTSPLAGSSTTFTWTYQFNANGGHDLSNIAIAFCKTDFLAHVVSATPSGETFVSGDVPGGHTGFGPGIKFATTAVSGTLTVVFDQAYPATGTMQIQSHSGDGDAGDLVTTTVGPGDCGSVPSTTPGGSTTTVAPTTTTVVVTTTTVAPTTTTVAPTTTTVPPTTTTVAQTTTTVAQTTTTTTVVVTTTTVALTTTTVPPTTTTVAQTTTTTPATTTTAPPTTTSTVPATTSTSVPTSVLGSRFVNDAPGDLAGTGFDGLPLVAFGALCIAIGAVLLVRGKLELSRN